MKQSKVKSRGTFRGDQPSFWNFWEDGVTASFLDLFLTCREQCRLQYVEGWSSRLVPFYFEFGTAGHYVLEKAYARSKVPTESKIEEWIEEYEDMWMKLVPSPTSRQLQQQELAYGMLGALMPAYFERWEGDFTGKYPYRNNTVKPTEWHSLEERFEVPYTFADGKKTVLRGKRDGVFGDIRKKTWVWDNKFRSMINHEEARDLLPVDLQQMLYLCATASQMAPQWPTGTLMNIVRRPGHRRGQTEELKRFLGRIKKDVSNPKKFDHNFTRYEMAISKAEIKEWKKLTLDPLMEDVRGWWEGRHPHYATHKNLTTKYGHATMYHPILKGDFTMCYRRRHVFAELAEA
jgi:hypothetical protein